MKRRDFNFDVMQSAPMGNIRLLPKERECSVNCYELVFGKESAEKKEWGVRSSDNEGEVEEDGKATYLAAALISAVILALALIILAL